MARRIEIDSYTTADDSAGTGATFWEWTCTECGQGDLGLPTEDAARDEADRHDCDED